MSGLLRTLLAFVVGVSLGGISRADDKPKPTDDLKALDGTWVTRSQTSDGEQVPADVAARQSFIFKDGKVTARGGLTKAGNTFFATRSVDKYKVELGTSEKLKTIDLVEDKEAGQKIPGIYKFEKDQLVMVLNYKNGDRPEKFETAADSGHCLFVLEKEVKPAPAKRADVKPQSAQQPGVDPGTVPSTPSPVADYGDQILIRLKVTDAEKAKWRAVNDEAGQKYQDMHAAYRKSGDMDQLMADRLLGMRWQRAEIEKILGAERYAQYKKLSAEAYKPLFDNGKGAPEIPILGRDGKPTAYKLRAITRPEDIEECERQLEAKLKKLGKLPAE